MNKPKISLHESKTCLFGWHIAAIERLAAAHPGETLLVVTHGGALQCLFERAAGRRPPGGAMPNGALGRIHVEGTKWALLDWGRSVSANAQASGGTWGGG